MQNEIPISITFSSIRNDTYPGTVEYKTNMSDQDVSQVQSSGRVKGDASLETLLARFSPCSGLMPSSNSFPRQACRTKNFGLFRSAGQLRLLKHLNNSSVLN